MEIIRHIHKQDIVGKQNFFKGVMPDRSFRFVGVNGYLDKGGLVDRVPINFFSAL